MISKEKIVDLFRLVLNHGLIYRDLRFDEGSYLAVNADVRDAVARGDYACGYDHWLVEGHAQPRPGTPPFDGVFDLEILRMVRAIARGDDVAAKAAIVRWRSEGPQRNRPEPDQPVDDPPAIAALVWFYEAVLAALAGASDRASFVAARDAALALLDRRPDYWAHRVPIWCDLGAGIIAEITGDIEAAVTHFERVRQTFWAAGRNGRTTVDYPPAAYLRATYHLSRIRAGQGRVIDALMLATTLANRCFTWRENTLRYMLHDRILASHRHVADGDEVAAARDLQVTLNLLQDMPTLFLKPAGASVEPVPTDEFDVVFVIGDSTSESMRYSAIHVADALRNVGLTACTAVPGDYETLVARRIRARHLVVFRADLDPAVRGLIAYFRAGGAITLFSIDDLFFDPTILSHMEGIKRLPPDQRQGAILAIETFRRSLFACDAGSGTTPVIVGAFRALGRPAFLIPLTVGRIDEALALSMPVSKRPQDRIVLGYFSGSWSHQKDVEMCLDGLVDVLEAYGNVDVMLVGHVAPPPKLGAFGARLRYEGFRSHQEMLALYREIDVSLSPVELGNPFTDAKSPTKIIEPALFGVPSVASASVPYRSAIEHGVDGFLATSREEWRAALTALVTSPELRHSMGTKARERALRDSASARLEQAVSDVYGKRGEAQKLVSRRLTIAFDVDTIDPQWDYLRRHLDSLSFFGHRCVTAQHFSQSMSIQKVDVLVRGTTGKIAAGEIVPKVVVNIAGDGGEPYQFGRTRPRAFVAPEGTLATQTVKFVGPLSPWIDHPTDENATTLPVTIDRFRYWRRSVETYPPRFLVLLDIDQAEMAEFASFALAIIRFEFPDAVLILERRAATALGGELPVAAVYDRGDAAEDLAALYSSARLALRFAAGETAVPLYEPMACEIPVVQVSSGVSELVVSNGCLIVPPVLEIIVPALRDLLKRKAHEEAAEAAVTLARTLPIDLEGARAFETLLFRLLAGA